MAYKPRTNTYKTLSCSSFKAADALIRRQWGFFSKPSVKRIRMVYKPNTNIFLDIVTLLSYGINL